MASDMNRREFLGSAAAAAASFTIVPRRVLGGAGFVAPSDRITLACVGFGTQAIREIGGILASPDVEVVAVCDVDRDGAGYLEWGRNQIRDGIRRLIDSPAWREGVAGVPGGYHPAGFLGRAGENLGHDLRRRSSASLSPAGA